MKSIAFNSSEFIINCELISPIRQTLDYYYSCFTFFSQLNREENNKYTIDYYVSIKNYWSDSIEFNVIQNISKIYLYLYSRHEMITDSNDDNFVELNFVLHYYLNVSIT
jgi:hypothetical protein